MIDFPRTAQAIEQGIAQGLHLGAQVFISRDGQPLADLAIGQSRPGVAMTGDALMLWLSGSKPIGAIAIARQWELGRLQLDDRVARHVPEFAAGGKQDVTIRHLLTHTAGFRSASTGWPEATWDETIARLCRAPQEPGWIAGRTAGYNAGASWFLLGEIVRRLDGRDYARYVREEIFLPLGMADSWLALPGERYRSYGSRIGIMYKTQRDKPGPTDAGLDSEAAAGAAQPAAGARGPARELARVYEMLLAGGTFNGRRLLLPQTVEALVARHRVGLVDRTFRCPMDWGLGFLLTSSQPEPASAPYAFDPAASPRAFGHGGAQSSIAFADPERGLAVVALTNGMPGEPAHHLRMRAILSAIDEDLPPRAEAVTDSPGPRIPADQ